MGQMKKSLVQAFATFRFSTWWKIVLVLNIGIDIILLLFVSTGYWWNCKYNQMPDTIFLGFVGLSTLILVWTFISSLGKNRRMLDFIPSGIISLFAIIMICAFSSLLLFPNSSEINALAPSPNSQRLAEICVTYCGPSCREQYTLRVSYPFLPFVDLTLANLNYEDQTTFTIVAPQVSWLSNRSIKVLEVGNISKIIAVPFLIFSRQYFLIFCFYIAWKYGYMIIRLQRQR